MKNRFFPLGVATILNTTPGHAEVYNETNRQNLTLDDLGQLAEWLAVAWENVAGEQYKPVVVSERGYVADEGVVTLERDCE